MSLLDILSTICLIIGTLLMVVAAFGMWRMPDLFIRMSATTKAGTVGLGFLLMALALHFAELGLTTRALAIFVFTLVTAPVSAHMIGRAAYSDGVKLWEGTKVDELRPYYESRKKSKR
ncbi:MAG: monovalent cation/H(+) antiporter subunit G [Chloroflexi bacterium]|nr:monovalent cation/H(+) antiporter subunit G [Chloroflexota bacterium]